jgi:hypothetical protein
MATLKELLEIDPNKKKGPEGYIRAQHIVTYMRQNMKPIITKERARVNKSYLFGMQDMTKIKAMFKDWQKSGVEFWQLAVMEKIVNVLIAEEELNGISFGLKAEDPTATNQRDRDAELISNRGWIDPTMTALQQQIGLPPYSMMNEKGLFNGNVDQIDKMGLDSSNIEDLNYFFAQHYRLLHEMVGEEPVNFFIKYNELHELIPMHMLDIIALKAAANKCYVNDMTGAVDYKYVAPENIHAIRGRRRDFKDATCLGYEENISIVDMIKLIGDDFDWDTDMNALMMAVNLAYGTNYTGIIDGTKLHWGTQDNCIEYNEFLSYTVRIGYIEWKEINAQAHKVTDANRKGNYAARPVSVYGKGDEKSIYQRDLRYYECTYKAYYLPSGTWNQTLYKYGELNWQAVEGAEDEYSNYSICVYQLPGKSAIEVAMPFIEFVEKNFKKMEWLVARAKPPGRGFNFESLMEVGNVLFPGKSPVERITATLEKFTRDSNEVFMLPKVNGQPVGGGTMANYDIPHGLPASAMQFQQMVTWGTNMIYEMLGISPLRQVAQPQDRDVLGLQQETNQYSEKATQYMHDVLVKIVNNLGKRTLLFVQDMVRFKDRNRLGYDFLLKALGDDTVAQLEHLEAFAFHRYGIFVEGLNRAGEKAEQQQIVLGALQKGEIDYAQYLLIRGINSPKKAILVLSYEKKRTERLQQQAAAQAQQSATALETLKHQNKMEEINAQGSWGDKRENTRGYWYDKGQQVRADAEDKKTQDKINAAPEQVQAKLDADIQKQQVAADLESQKPMVATG